MWGQNSSNIVRDTETEQVWLQNNLGFGWRVQIYAQTPKRKGRFKSDLVPSNGKDAFYQNVLVNVNPKTCLLITEFNSSSIVLFSSVTFFGFTDSLSHWQIYILPFIIWAFLRMRYIMKANHWDPTPLYVHNEDVATLSVLSCQRWWLFALSELYPTLPEKSAGPMVGIYVPSVVRSKKASCSAEHVHASWVDGFDEMQSISSEFSGIQWVQSFVITQSFTFCTPSWVLASN